MEAGFKSANEQPPSPEEIIGVVGLTLKISVEQLRPNFSPDTVSQIVLGFRQAYLHIYNSHSRKPSSPLFPYAREILEELHLKSCFILGIATGNSRQGMESFIKEHRLESFFKTTQCTDYHPSKPHPAMIYSALLETGIDKYNTAIIGDTSFDIKMGVQAGVKTIGVSWGYHDVADLVMADYLVNDFRQIPELLRVIWDE